MLKAANPTGHSSFLSLSNNLTYLCFFVFTDTAVITAPAITASMINANGFAISPVLTVFAVFVGFVSFLLPSSPLLESITFPDKVYS